MDRNGRLLILYVSNIDIDNIELTLVIEHKVWRKKEGFLQVRLHAKNTSGVKEQILAQNQHFYKYS